MKFDLKDFKKSSQELLEELVEKIGNAELSVLVGSGFSKNAKPISNQIKTKFPDWEELKKVYCSNIHSKHIDAEELEIADVLEIADIIVRLKDRKTLEDITIDAIPDNDYMPSELYYKLLQLSWIDIFSTNFDTLLEKTNNDIKVRKYQNIISKEDLYQTDPPRIIKLHGTFPSNRPFIISQTDYDKYEEKYSPFLVKIKETLYHKNLCLIGFSGKDPNFQNWMKWLQHEVEDYAHKPYLICVDNLTRADESDLSEYVQVVNLKDVFEGESPEELLSKLFDKLKVNEISNAPNQSISTQTSLCENDVKWRVPPPNATESDTIENVTSYWKNAREAYPKWVIFPEACRKNLFENTRNWARHFDSKRKVKLDIDFIYEFNWRWGKALLPLFGDMVERIESCISEYSSHDEMGKDKTTPQIQQKLDELRLSLIKNYRQDGDDEKWKKHNRYFENSEHELSSTIKNALNYERCNQCLYTLNIPKFEKTLQAWSTDELSPIWKAKKASLIAENGNIEEAMKIVKIALVDLAKMKTTDNNKNDHYIASQEALILQHIIYYLINYDWTRKSKPTQSVENIKEEFQQRELKFNSSSSDMYGQEIINSRISKENKIIYCHIEKDQSQNNLFDVKDGKEITPDTLPESVKDMAAELNSQVSNTNAPESESDTFIKEYISAIYSRELESIINDLNYKEIENERRKHSERLISISSGKNSFNINTELVFFRNMITRDKSKKPQHEINYLFDIGQKLNSYNQQQAKYEEFSSYCFMRFNEEAGFVSKIPGVSIEYETVSTALKQIFPNIKHWALIEAVRTGNKKIADDVLSREQLAQVTSENANSMARILIKSLRNVIPMIKKNNIGRNLSNVVPELLSRLCTKCSSDMLEKIYKFLKEIASSQPGWVSIISKRLITSWTITEIFDHLSEYVHIGSANMMLTYEMLDWKKEKKVDIPNIKNLFDKLNKHPHYLNQIIILERLGLLKPNYSKKLGELLWNDLDEKTGFPKLWSGGKDYLLNLPCPNSIDPELKLKEYLRTNLVTENINDKGAKTYSSNYSVCREMIEGSKTIFTKTGITWDEEAVELLEKCTNWFNSKLLDSIKRGSFTDPQSQNYHQRSLYDNIVIILGIVIPTYITELPEHLKKSVVQIRDKCKQNDLQYLRISTGFLPFIPEIKNELVDNINEKFESRDEYIVNDALSAIELILLRANDGSEGHKQFAATMLTLLGLRLRMRMPVGLIPSLKIAKRVIEDMPAYRIDLQDDLLTGLHYLIDESKTINEDSELEVGQRLEVRQLCAKISYLMYGVYKKEHKRIPDTLKLWKAVCNDPEEFADIRNQWLK